MATNFIITVSRNFLLSISRCYSYTTWPQIHFSSTTCVADFVHMDHMKPPQIRVSGSQRNIRNLILLVSVMLTHPRTTFTTPTFSKTSQNQWQSFIFLRRTKQRHFKPKISKKTLLSSTRSTSTTSITWLHGATMDMTRLGLTMKSSVVCWGIHLLHGGRKWRRNFRWWSWRLRNWWREVWWFAPYVERSSLLMRYSLSFLVAIVTTKTVSRTGWLIGTLALFAVTMLETS